MATRAITGDVPSGSTLEFVDYIVTGYPTPSVDFQWKRDDVAITGATGPTYQLTDLDVGTEITVEVTATNIFATRIKTGGITGGFGITSGPSGPSGSLNITFSISHLGYND